ncbi:hypothetical protein BD779DRAFT_1543640 [Infundibulicybe gibba]|nr:hypothetical protein BD779DRAFT_1543640 [Infundibulicybe gibba]
MWLLKGPFDGDASGEANFSKTKCLKNNTTYPLGRKDRALVVASRKVSQEHCDFVVGDYTVEDVTCFAVCEQKNKAMMVLRGDNQIVMNQGATYDLQDSDTIAIVGGVFINTVGINVIYKSNAQTTHHLTQTFAATPAAAASLISACHFAKPEWLLEVIRLGNLPPTDATSLQNTFNLPGTSKFRPTFSPSLLPPQKIFNVWEPNEERLNFFKNCRFICIGEPGKELDSDLRDAITRGAGAIETFDVHRGKTKLHKVLTRGRAKQGAKLIIICDSKSMEASIGHVQWLELAAEIASFDLGATPPANIIQAVLTVDIHILDSPSVDIEMPNASESSSLPEFVPNTLSQEPSIPPVEQPPPKEEPKPVKKLTRRATSRQPSIEPIVVVADEPLETELPRRRALTRRVNANGPILTGIDDPSVILTMPPVLDAPAEPPPVVDLTAPTPGRPSRLKRRAVGSVPPESQSGLGFDALLLRVESATEEPPLKKFKALFDASHPDRAGTGSVETFSELRSATISDSQTQSQTQTRSGHPRMAAPAVLDLVEEEEEETQSGPVVERRAKRKFTFDDDAMVEDDPEVGSSTTFKKRAIEDVNNVEKVNAPPTNTRASRPPDSDKVTKPTKSGAPPGNPDKDPAFLKALASTKRGKKAESEFDREFNNLKISKPDLGREIQENEWAVLDDFSRETNIRGNFMVVMELDVFKKTNASPGSNPVISTGLENPISKNLKSLRINQVQVFANQEPTTASGQVGPYWKGKGKQDLATFENTQATSETRNDLSQPSRKTKTQPLMIDSDEDIVMIPEGKTKKAASRAGSAVPSRRATTKTKKAPAKANPLFLDSDDEHIGSRPPQFVKQNSSRGEEGQSTVVRDDDDEVAFKGF